MYGGRLSSLLLRACAFSSGGELSFRRIAGSSLDFVEQQLSARAAFLRAIRGPVRAFYDSLSPEQRAMLQPSPVGRL